MTDIDLLPADPERGVTADALAEEESEFDGVDYRFGMSTAAGAARLAAALDGVASVLAAGCRREAALAALHGFFVRLERDGHREYSDTVVRETVGEVLAGSCEAAGVAAFTDEEIGEVALLLSLRSTEAAVAGWLKGAAR